MTVPSEFLDAVTKESYEQYERLTGITLPRFAGGEFDLRGGIAHNNELDAFRHAYVSARFTQEYGDIGANLLGIANEVSGKIALIEESYFSLDYDAKVTQNQKESNMDLWNNDRGREIGNFNRSASSDEIASAVKGYINLGFLITVPSDAREYEGDISDSIGDNMLNLLNSIESLSGDIRLYAQETYDNVESSVCNLVEQFGLKILHDVDIASSKFNNLTTGVNDFLKDYLDNLVNDAHTIGSYLSDVLKGLSRAEATAPNVVRRDPLTLDLDGDGVELVSLTKSNTFFDLDEDGLRERVGWVKADDGILIFDENANNSVDNINELFGYVDENGNEVTGTAELKTYDTGSVILVNQTDAFGTVLVDDNGNPLTQEVVIGANDGVIDLKDAIFSQLKLWQDLNQDGISQDGELRFISSFY